MTTGFCVLAYWGKDMWLVVSLISMVFCYLGSQSLPYVGGWATIGGRGRMTA